MVLATETTTPDGKIAAWFRLHAQLVASGIWADLKPCSRAVLVVLASLLDNKKRITYGGVQRVAALAGLSTARTTYPGAARPRANLATASSRWSILAL